MKYATDRGHIIEDTDLISRDEAEELWEKYWPDFTKRIGDDCVEPAEMALWVNCENNTSYGETAKHYHTSDFIKTEGQLFIRFKEGV